ncbi:hypothetical protein SAMN04490248_12820 [Salinihabitans flavidus]|uniref:Curlin associated repeat-containing protein n=1 Tax=Salinihabitans flavidus TaxID=569882 RepID=A0A1H8VEM8_9RHOB|nr:hypothetical protein [Salinihabitans flavidus]SEP13677.1 hypothetical protein SAMN04490248_12820 [Salinihabitans flavidus]
MGPFQSWVRTATLAGALAVALAATSASANETAKLLELDIAGDDNTLQITQHFTQSGSAAVNDSTRNILSITITGNRNGGVAETWRTSLPFASRLAPGEIVQSGFGNALSVSVTGHDNLFAMAQSGQNNRISGEIFGNSNQSVVTQAGTGNTTVFRQTGQRNNIVVSQRSY